MSVGGVSVRIDPVGQDIKAWKKQETMSNEDNLAEFCSQIVYEEKFVIVRIFSVYEILAHISAEKSTCNISLHIKVPIKAIKSKNKKD